MKISFLLIAAMFFPLLHAEVSKGSNCKDDSYYKEYFSKTKDPESFNLEWGRCEEHLGNTERAIDAYERTLIYNDKNSEAREALEKLYEKSGIFIDPDDGQDNMRLTPRQRQTISSLDERREENGVVRSRISAELKYGYDNNINHSIYLPLGGFVSRRTIGSSFYSFDMKGSISADIGEEDGFAFNSNAEIYWKNNSKEDMYDVGFASFDAGPEYNLPGITLYLPLYYERVRYLDQDLYQDYGFNPSITFPFAESLLFNMNARYIKHEYMDNLLKGGNSTLRGVSAGLYRFFGENYVYLRAEYTDSDADSDAPMPLTDYLYREIAIGFSYEIINGTVLDMDYMHGYGKYWDMPPLAAFKKRKDNINQLHFSLDKRFGDSFHLTADYIYTDSDCNFKMQAYEKRVFSVGLKYAY